MGAVEVKSESAVGGDLVLISKPSQGVAALTINRPAQRNALSRAMIAALDDEIRRLSSDREVGAIVITGAGTVFCAGHDLKELTAHRADADGGRAFFTETITACSAMMQAIVACPKPVIAAVHGVATAAGCQLVATCDLAVAGEHAAFATPGVNIGLFCSTPMVALSRTVTRKRALEMLLLGDAIGAREAAEWGLVNRVVGADAVQTEAFAMARAIASKSEATVAVGKAAFYAQIERPLASAYDYASEVMIENMLSRDAEEGICAFVEKRAPTWQDR